MSRIRHSHAPLPIAEREVCECLISRIVSCESYKLFNCNICIRTRRRRPCETKRSLILIIYCIETKFEQRRRKCTATISLSTQPTNELSNFENETLLKLILFNLFEQLAVETKKRNKMQRKQARLNAHCAYHGWEEPIGVSSAKIKFWVETVKMFGCVCMWQPTVWAYSLTREFETHIRNKLRKPTTYITQKMVEQTIYENNHIVVDFMTHWLRLDVCKKHFILFYALSVH